MERLYERVVIPVGGTSADEWSLALLPKLAAPRSAIVTLLYIVEVALSIPLDSELPVAATQAERALTRAEAVGRAVLANRKATIQTELVQARSIGAAIVDEALANRAELILMTATLRRRHGRMSLGDTVDHVLLHAPCEVVLVRLPLPDVVSKPRMER